MSTSTIPWMLIVLCSLLHMEIVKADQEKEVNYSMLCQKDYFLANYQEKILGFRLNEMAKLMEGCSNEMKGACYLKPYTENLKESWVHSPNSTEPFTFNYSTKINPKCFGMLVELTLKGKTTKKFIKTEILSEVVIAGYNENFKLTIYAIPAFEAFAVEKTTESLCFMKLEEKLMKNKDLPLMCKNKSEKRVIKENACRKSNGDYMKAMNCFVDEFCTKVSNQPEKFKIYIVAAVAFCLFVCIIIYLMKKYGQRNCLPFTSSSRENRPSLQMSKKTLLRNEVNVLLINPPGCERLDILLKHFTVFLKSNDINVFSPFIENGEIFEAGGIGSYLARNIDKCHYILLVFSDHKVQENTSYKFVMNMVLGMLPYGDNASKCIVITTETLQRSLKFIPIAFHAFIHPGYEIPKHAKKVLSTILSLTLNKKTKIDKSVMTVGKYQIEEMRKSKEDYQQSQHPECFKMNCAKGMLQDKIFSYSNLSTAWPTTVQSQTAESRLSLTVGHDVMFFDADDRYEPVNCQNSENESSNWKRMASLTSI